jgi:hypothetical protein
MSKLPFIEDYFGKNKHFVKKRGENVCSVCCTKMSGVLSDIPFDFDWNSNLRLKLQIVNYPICNQCYYHLVLITILGIDDEIIIDSKHFVNAYIVSMQNEKGNFFDATNLACTTIKIGDTLESLESRDELQAHYCITFNNTYDILCRGTVNWYLSKSHWDKVYHYSKSRFSIQNNTPCQQGQSHE